MHHALAVLQPSTFEGWSTSVEESKAMAKRIILSNIDVHVEQAPKRGIYFPPHSAEDLAMSMMKASQEYDPVEEQQFASRRPKYKLRIEKDWIENFSRILIAVLAPTSEPSPSSV